MSTSIKIDHVAVMVSDLERSLRFYRDILGLEVVSPEEHNDGPISIMVDIPKVRMREYRMRAPAGIHGHTRNEGAGFTLDLIQWLNPVSPAERYPIHHVPSAHICFGVEDVPATYERLKAAGVEIVSPPVRFTGEGEWHVLFFYDPDGNLLELNETGTGQQEPHHYEWSTA
ncbi:VOC family protein [Candidatus Entotheonella palauensis]|uniref:VOC family protein n=1 Tax=Candidatus Entotheonella palauensis TaxID=93172 RepID=UPI000B7DE9AF|nr:VOC family protein [Candidatus Entotheonella palauensis]